MQRQRNTTFGDNYVLWLAGMAHDALGFHPHPSEPLMAAGLKSLGAVELRNAITAAYNIQLAATAALDFPTLDSLAAHLVTRLDTIAPADKYISEGHRNRSATNRCSSRTLAVGIVAVDLSEVTSQLLKVVENVLGTAVSPQQPFMEVSMCCH